MEQREKKVMGLLLTDSGCWLLSNGRITKKGWWIVFIKGKKIRGRLGAESTSFSRTGQVTFPKVGSSK